jgi:hypothetical protein
VGTDIGVYRTQNANVASPTWTLLGTGLPNVAVFGLKLHQASRTLRAATHGRGFWDLAVPSNVNGAGMFITPTTLTFSVLEVSRYSNPQTITLTNNGNATTNISSISVSINAVEFLINNKCGSTLAVGASCTVDVTFHPNGTGSRTGQLSVTSNATPATTTIDLSGSAVNRPPNDDFAKATVLSGTFSENVDTRVATTEAGEQNPSDACIGGAQFQPTNNRSIWYRFTPTGSGTISLSTSFSDHDTVLTIWTGSALGALTQQSCSDDINPGIVQQSQIDNFNVTAGTTYYIAATSYNSTSGLLVFNFSTSLSGNTNGAVVASPSALTMNTLSGVPVQVSTSTTLTNVLQSNVSVSNVTVDAPFTVNHNCATITRISNCTITVSYSGTGTSASGNVNIADSLGGRTIPVTMTAAGFTLKAGRLSRPLRSGPVAQVESASYEVQLAVDGGSAASPQSIALTCDGAPAGSTCTVEPASVPFQNGVTAVAVKVTPAASPKRASRLGAANGMAEGNYLIHVNATLGTMVKTVDLPLQVTKAATAAPASPAQRGPRGIQKR